MLARAAVRELEGRRDAFDPSATKRKLELLAFLERARLGSFRDVLRLHECLCFLRAYPDSAAVLERV